MTEYLTEGLSDVERRMAIIVEKYIESCNQTVQNGSSAHTELLAWTTLYRRKDVLESACTNGESIDWFRSVCYVLDQKRLRDALKYAEGKRDASKKRGRKVDEDNNENDMELRKSAERTAKRLRLKGDSVFDGDFPKMLGSSSTQYCLRNHGDQITCFEKQELSGDNYFSPLCNLSEKQVCTTQIQKYTSTEQQNTLLLSKPMNVRNKYIFSWSFKVLDVLRNHIDFRSTPCQLSNGCLSRLCDNLIDLLEWFGVTIDDECGLNHSCEALHSLLLSLVIESSSDNAPISKSTLVEKSHIQQEGDLMPFALLLNDEVIFSRQLPQKPSGEWQNPKFVEWLTQMSDKEIRFLKIKKLCQIDNIEEATPIDNYIPTGHSVDGLVVFGMGVVSLIVDTMEEFWGRVRGVITRINMITSPDILQEIRMFSNLPAFKCCVNSGIVDMSLLMAELEKLLEHPKLPKDLQDSFAPVSKRLKSAQEEWKEIQKYNETKRRAAEEEEKAKRDAAVLEATKRDEKRREIVEFIKEGIRREERLPEKNPFWVLGLDPASACNGTLLKLKRKLSLILHPDKCTNTEYRHEVHEAFLAVNNTIAAAQDLLQSRRNFSVKSALPQRFPPYADLIGLKPSSNALPQKKEPYTSSSAGVGQSTSSSKSEATKKNGEELGTKLFAFHPPKFSSYLLESRKTVLRISSPKMPLPTVIAAYLSSRRFDLRISAASPLHQIRVFVSRPMCHTETSNVENWWTAQIREFLNGTHKTLKAIKMCSAIFHCNHHFFDIAHLKNPESFLQPAHDSIRDSAGIFLAVQSIDCNTNDVSEIVFTMLKPLVFKIPSIKSRVIEMIQTFDNAPEGYEVHSFLRSTLNIEVDNESFPSAAILSGKYTSELKSTLEQIVNKAADIELNRMSDVH